MIVCTLGRALEKQYKEEEKGKKKKTTTIIREISFVFNAYF